MEKISQFLSYRECDWYKKWSFPLRISSMNVTKSALVSFTEEIRNEKL